MAATYSTSLETEKDWVRFLSADTDVPDNARLQDETIAALLAEGNRWLAAAEALSLSRATASSTTGPVIEKVVGDLRLKFQEGNAASATSAFDDYIAWLRQRGAQGTGPSPYLFANL